MKNKLIAFMNTVNGVGRRYADCQTFGNRFMFVLAAMFNTVMYGAMGGVVLAVIGLFIFLAGAVLYLQPLVGVGAAAIMAVAALIAKYVK